MKILVTGVSGQLGHDVMRELAQRSIEAIPVGRAHFDLTKPEQVRNYILSLLPNAVIHCAAYTAVDRAEDEPDLCQAVNVGGTNSLALACREIGAKMLYISTDYVFPGSGDKPYEVNDRTAPLNMYGQSKLDGELVLKEALKQYFVVRTSWVFGTNGNNFVKTMLRLGKVRNEINVVCDQIGSPTYTSDLAPLLCDMITGEKYGVYHATNEEFCSWADFTEEIFKDVGYKTRVKHILTSEYPAKADRPLNSRLSKVSLDEGRFNRLPSWKNALKRYFEALR